MNVEAVPPSGGDVDARAGSSAGHTGARAPLRPTDLVEIHLGGRFLGSGMSDHAVEQMFSGLMASWELGLAGEESATEEEFQEAVVTEFAVLPTRRAPELDGHRRGVMLAQARAKELELPDLIATVGARIDGDKAAAWDSLGGLLDIEGVAVLEIESHLRGPQLRYQEGVRQLEHPALGIKRLWSTVSRRDKCVLG